MKRCEKAGDKIQSRKLSEHNENRYKMPCCTINSVDKFHVQLTNFVSEMFRGAIEQCNTYCSTLLKCGKI